MTADTDDLADLLAALPPYDPLAMLREVEEARRAAETAPPPEPSIIPQAEHVYPAGRLWWAPILAFPCPHRCGWAHMVDPVAADLEDAARPFVIPAGTAEEVSRAISARADARAEEQRAGLEDAIREHLRTAHSDHEGVREQSQRPRLSSPAVGHGAAPPSSPPMAGPPHVRGES
ncbi:hypothetical protein [Streptomyces canus]|uniref:hypothetical protein n=1 Tax=Streptomyces canus TaxID=58343 RepID=UPI002E261328